MSRYFRYLMMEYSQLLRTVFTVYWWITFPIITLIMALFAESSDLFGRLVALAMMFPIMKFIFTQIKMREEERSARETAQYRREPAYSVGPRDNVFDFPTYQRRQHLPGWAEQALANQKNPPFDDVPPADPKILDFPTFKRRNSRPFLN